MGCNQVDKYYLDLLKNVLSFNLWEDRALPRLVSRPKNKVKRALLEKLDTWLKKRGLQLAVRSQYVPELREHGLDWPLMADSMIGIRRLTNLQECMQSVIRDNVKGDCIETGVWRGGAVIFMRATLKAYGIEDRIIWAADSFEGLPAPNDSKYPADLGAKFHQYKVLSVELDEVKANISRYGLLDSQIQFLKGWFKDTLHVAPIKELAILRLDGDMYESTMDALKPLYPKLSIGGYVIVDDYGIESCKKAISDYRTQHGIVEPLVTIDKSGAVYWRRER